MSTIREVAALAGVSTATVSRVINNDTTYKMTDETKEKVWEAIAKLDYKADISSHKLSAREKRSVAGKEIGVILNINKDKYSDPYYLNILTGIEQRLENSGYTLAFVRSNTEFHDSNILDKTFELPPAGLISMNTLTEDIYGYIRKRVPHIIGVDTLHSDIDNVGYDHYEVSELAVNYLASKGYREIGYIGSIGPDGTILTSKRFRSYYATLNALGLPFNPDWVLNCMWDDSICTSLIEKAYEEKKLPRAFFVGSDLMAMAALRALYSLHVSVPDDIAIMGMSNIEMSCFSTPPLSTIDIPKKDMGYLAADLLIRRIEGDDTTIKRITVPGNLIVREST